MIKKISLVSFLILMIFNLFACGTSTAKKEDANAETETSENTDEFDGNVMEIVNIEEGKFSKTLSKPFKKDSYTKKEQDNINEVKRVLDGIDLEKDSKIIECVYGSIDDDVSVWSLVKDRSGKTLNNYGMIIRSGKKNFVFADVCHGNNPNVDYDEKSGRMLIAGGLMEGTGTHTEGLYIFNVKKGKAEKIGFVDPYDVQNYFEEQISFDVNNKDIKFKMKNKVISEVTDTEDGQGTLRALAIGDQISYDFDDKHNVKVNVTPGKQFVTVVTMDQIEKDVSVGKVVVVSSGSEMVAVAVNDGNKKEDEELRIIMNNPAGTHIGTTEILSYEDMPTFTTDVKINGANATFANIKVE